MKQTPIKILLLSLSFLFISNFSQAQFSISGEVGVVRSSIDINEYLATQFKPSFLNSMYFSIIPRYSVSEKVSVATELSYSTKGYLLDVSQSGVKASFISLSPQVEYKLLKFASIYSGINFEYKIDEKFKLLGHDWEELNVLGKLNTKELEFAIPIGLRLFFGKLQLNLSYNLGISDIVGKIINQEGDSNFEYRRYFKLGIGYQFL